MHLVFGPDGLAAWFPLLELSPAKVFMGMSAAPFLGGVCGFGLIGFQLEGCVCYLLLATPLLADACLCASRLAGQRVFKAHRLHLFQRLQQAGWPHSRVSLLHLGDSVAGRVHRRPAVGFVSVRC